MTIPPGLFTIIRYRDFYDVPRLILAVDQASRYWIFDSTFDDELDEYSSYYNVYSVNYDSKDAEKAIAFHSEGIKGAIESVVPVDSIRFDLSKRRTFTVGHQVE